MGKRRKRKKRSDKVRESKEAKKSPPPFKELPTAKFVRGCHGPNAVVYTGAVLVRMPERSDVTLTTGQTAKRFILSGAVVGENVLEKNAEGVEEDEIWDCQIILVPRRRYRDVGGAVLKHLDPDQILTAAIDVQKMPVVPLKVESEFADSRFS